MFKRILSLNVIFCFFLTTLGPIPQAHADTVLGLPVPGTMVNLSPVYEPALIKGLTIHKDNPFLFDFIVDAGHRGLSEDALKKEGDRLVKYFFACLTIPEKDLWVNLSPYEKDRIIPQALGQTALGRDLLAQDYILKQLTASLIYPEKNLGKEFWDKVYAKAQRLYGTTQIPVNTFNKVWILADQATVYEHGQTAFIVDGHLKVMLDEDYLAKQKHQATQASSVSSQVVREVVLPEIEREVNTGKNFAMLRQIFYSQILATWYKKNLKEALLNQVYSDKSTVQGVNVNDPSVKEKIYQQYLKAYKKGVFNYIKEDAQGDGQIIPRKYFSGGYGTNPAMLTTITAPTPQTSRVFAGLSGAPLFVFSTGAQLGQPMSDISTPEDAGEPNYEKGGLKLGDLKSDLVEVLSRYYPTRSVVVNYGHAFHYISENKGKQLVNRIISDLSKATVGKSHSRRFVYKIYIKANRQGSPLEIYISDAAMNISQKELLGWPPGEKSRLVQDEAIEFLRHLLMKGEQTGTPVYVYEVQDSYGLNEEPTNEFNFYRLGYYTHNTLALSRSAGSWSTISEDTVVVVDPDGTIRVIPDSTLDGTLEYEIESLPEVSVSDLLDMAMTQAPGNRGRVSIKDVIGYATKARAKALQSEKEFRGEADSARSTADRFIASVRMSGRSIEESSDRYETADEYDRESRVAREKAEGAKREAAGWAVLIETLNADPFKKVASGKKTKEELSLLVGQSLKKGTKALWEQAINQLIGTNMDRAMSRDEEDAQKTPRELALEQAEKKIRQKPDARAERLRLAELYKEGASFSSTEERERAQAAYEELQREKDQENRAMMSKGGIDLNTSSGMQWKVSKDGRGVEMNIDPAMIERVKREGLDSLSPVIFRITPVTSIWPLVGLQAPR